MRLFITAPSPYVRKCRIVIREKGLTERVQEVVADPYANDPDLVAANPIAQAVLLMQRAFWIGTTDDPVVTAATQMPDYLYLRGAISLVVAFVILGIGQLVFSRLENRIPEHL